MEKGVVRPYVQFCMIVTYGTITGWRVCVTRGQIEKGIKEEGVKHSNGAHSYIPKSYLFLNVRSSDLYIQDISLILLNLKESRLLFY